MDSFGDDLSSPLPKRGPEMMEGVVMERPLTKDVRELVEPRVVALKPLRERLGRMALRPRAPAVEESGGDDLWSQLSDDMVEIILARLPLLPLKACKKVCRRWAAVVSTPQFEALNRELGEQHPWLVCYCINSLVARKSQALAYDVESDAWRTIPQLQFPSHNGGSLAAATGLVYAIAGTAEDRFRYMLTSSTTSPDTFAATWYETPAMTFPRASPVVSAALGTGSAHKVVVAGGAPKFEDEHSAVEVFDSQTGAWEVYPDLPDDFSESSSRAWMSSVVCENRFYVSLNHAWSIHVLDLDTKEWSELQWERPQELISHHIVAIGATLVVAAVCGDANNPDENFVLKLWKVDSESGRLTQIGCMPRQGLAALGRQYTCLVSENLVYIVDSDAQDSALVVGEVSLQECTTQWRQLPQVGALGHRFDHLVAFCSSISIAPLS